jgi:bifunctional non-homologous end joining protein LigD
MQLHPEAVSEFRFIQPCSPISAKHVPAGEDWQHEIKFDGFRVQIHKLGNEVELYSRNGLDSAGASRGLLAFSASCRSSRPFSMVRL